MSESYCCKVYQKISRYLLRILSVSGRKALLDGNLKAIAIDVTEQPIECPVIGQQDYFSGKKTAHDKGSVDYPFDNVKNLDSLLCKRNGT